MHVLQDGIVVVIVGIALSWALRNAIRTVRAVAVPVAVTVNQASPCGKTSGCSSCRGC